MGKMNYVATPLLIAFLLGSTALVFSTLLSPPDPPLPVTQVMCGNEVMGRNDNCEIYSMTVQPWSREQIDVESYDETRKRQEYKIAAQYNEDLANHAGNKRVARNIGLIVIGIGLYLSIHRSIRLFKSGEKKTP